MSEEHWDQEIHQRLLTGDVTAPSELVEKVLPYLNEELATRNPRFRNSELIADAITDTLISYIKAPHQFDPARLPFKKYLIMSAQRDFQNALAMEKRRRAKESPLENVELLEDVGNKGLREDFESLDSNRDRTRILQNLKSRFRDPKDLQMLELILDGERATEKFAVILEIENLPLDHQRRAVKKHKDRLKKRLERYAEKAARGEKS